MTDSAMFYDFDTVIPREHTYAEKYTLREKLFGRADIFPMWVADMDLATPPFIIDALKNRLDHPILGYTQMPEELYEAIIYWQGQHNYQVNAKDILFTHNVANGFHLAIQALTRPGENILVQPPIYPPFLSAPIVNQRNLIEAPLKLKNQRYEIDFEAFEQTLLQQRIKLFLFSNPQNPSGRVWQKHELLRLGDLCLKHQVIIVSDEIHSDLVYAGQTHYPLASLSPALAQITVTLSSPGKTFNLGGLQIGYAIIANPKLKADYLQLAESLKIHDLNLFAMHATLAAYTPQGLDYKHQLLTYLQQNIDLVVGTLNQHFPEIKVMRPEASYLIWLDFSKLALTQTQLKQWLVKFAKLGLNDGLSFGQAGLGFMRMNIALPRSQLKKALAQLVAAKPDFTVG